MAEKTIATSEIQKGTPTAEELRSRGRYITPPVDIYETPEKLVVTADLPGVVREDLEVRVDNNLLTIQGNARHMAVATPIYQEYELIPFFRQFELSEKIDTEKIIAELKYGMLSLHLPKAAEAKPRKIEVVVAA